MAEHPYVTPAVACPWCKQQVQPVRGLCTSCGLHVLRGDPTAASAPRSGGKTSSRRARQARRTPLDETPVGQPVLGIDPGARNVGVVLRDGDAVLYASTLRRDDAVDEYVWPHQVVAEVKAALGASRVPMGIEGVHAPRWHMNGEVSPVRPKDLIALGMVVGALTAVWPQAVVIHPGKNGSQHVSHYPRCLVGRRPPELSGSTAGGKRAHEQSAFDVAGKAALVAYPLDLLRERYSS